LFVALGCCLFVVRFVGVGGILDKIHVNHVLPIHPIATRGYPPTAALLISSFQNARSRIQLTRTTDVGVVASFRAEMAKREVSQFALQPRVLVRRVKDCAGGRARYGSRVEGVRLR
jgi:hypothetical protein